MINGFLGFFSDHIKYLLIIHKYAFCFPNVISLFFVCRCERVPFSCHQFLFREDPTETLVIANFCTIWKEMLPLQPPHHTLIKLKTFPSSLLFMMKSSVHSVMLENANYGWRWHVNGSCDGISRGKRIKSMYTFHLLINK